MVPAGHEKESGTAVFVVANDELLVGSSLYDMSIQNVYPALGDDGERVALAIAEEYGGSGCGLSELAVVLEAQGRELCPGPFLPTVAAAVVIDRCAPDSVRAQLLPGLAGGSVVGALGLSGSVDVGSDLGATGVCAAMLGAPDATALAMVAGDDVVLVAADADGVTVTRLPSLDTTRSIGSVALRNVAMTEDRVLRGCSAARPHRVPHPGVRGSRRNQLGRMDRAVEYAKVREQFGRTIGTFQAVKHHAANMLVNAVQTTAATWDAARSDNLDSAWFEGAVAASHAIRTQIFNAQCNIQLHGGIGFTWEHDAHCTCGGPARGGRTCPTAPRSTARPHAKPSPRGGRCRRRSGATSWSTPGIGFRTGRGRGEVPRGSSSSS